MTTNDTPGTGAGQDAIERGAQVIADALTEENRRRWTRGGSSVGYPPLDMEVTPSLLRVARAAIAAMPSAPPVAVTEAMVEAGANALESRWAMAANYVSRDDIRVMLTAALGAGGPPLEDLLPAGWNIILVKDRHGKGGARGVFEGPLKAMILNLDRDTCDSLANALKDAANLLEEAEVDGRLAR